jgi:hypothetical protein
MKKNEEISALERCANSNDISAAQKNGSVELGGFHSYEANNEN